MRLKKLIYRATRGLAWVEFFDIDEKMSDYEGKQMDMCVYFVIYPATVKILKQRIEKICHSFNSHTMEFPSRMKDINSLYAKTVQEEKEAFDTLQKTEGNFKAYLTHCLEHKRLENKEISVLAVYRFYLQKSVQIYQTINKLKTKANICFGLIWVPEYLEETLRQSITRGAMIKRIEDFQGLEPPTYFRLNEFSFAFHEIVTTYGIPNYKEINPTTFNMVTFPFLFGIMFGDIGHGGILFGAAVWLCWNKEKALKMHAAMEGFIKARYLLLLMGFFATYCGLVYNDFMSIPLNLFGSCYQTQDKKTKEFD